MALQSSAPILAHPLPPAPHFVGRQAELDELRGLWQSGFSGVVALVGLGGAGKTAVAARFLEDVLTRAGDPRPASRFVWSFYLEPDAGLFLQEYYRFRARPGTASMPAQGAGLPQLVRDDQFLKQTAGVRARGAGLLHMLGYALRQPGPHLLVLDGLERVQRQRGDVVGDFGQVEDPLLKGLLIRIAEECSQVFVLVTSRFPLTDLEPYQAQGYRHLDVGGLDRGAAFALLRQRGVRGDDDELERLVDGYGAHALTLDHLGGLIGEFLNGDPSRAPLAPALARPDSDRQALRLARLLRTYEEHLPPAELALLCRLCLLRRGVRLEQVRQLFLCSPAVHVRTARELGERIKNLGEGGRLPAVARELGEAVRQAIEEALCRSPLAGPDEVFQQEVRTAVQVCGEAEQLNVDGDFTDLARLYVDTTLDVPTEQRPLSAADRRQLRMMCARYNELRSHPLMPYKQPAPAVAEAFADLGWSKRKRRTIEDLGPADVLRAFRSVQGRLHILSVKHAVLHRVRVLCRLKRQKWSLAGPLASLDAAELDRVLDALVGRHLVLREADGCFSIHPAVRDHFGRLATVAEQGAWHDVLREQLISLIRRPGQRHPEDTAALDLLEDAIHHALQAGRTGEAWRLYDQVGGGLRHLGWKLGEMARGLRILRSFQPCPEGWALAWYLRALGELEEAHANHALPPFRAAIRLLQGRLPQVAVEGDDAHSAMAAFLMGQTKDLPPEQLGSVALRVQAMVHRGLLFPALRQLNLIARLFQEMGWEGERARCQLWLAEAARRLRNEALCQHHLQIATPWILHAGAVEHLCLFHLVRARTARDSGNGEAAQREVDEGLHLARQYGLGLFHIDLLCTQAELSLDRADATAAEHLASAALERATADNCRFLWGAAEAGQLLGRALLAQQRQREASTILQKTLAVQQRLGDLQAEKTRLLLETLHEP
jgi:hypothetical protein